MKVRDIMTDQVEFVSPTTTIVETAQLMQKHNVGAIPVCEGQNVVGIVTDRDIIVRNVAHGKDPSQTPVKDVMSSRVRLVTPEMDLSEAATIMAHEQVRRLPVVENNRLIGIVALGDFATQAKYDVELSRTIGEISQPSKPEQI